MVKYLFLLLMMSALAACNEVPKKNSLQDSPTSGTIHISVDESFRPVMEEQIKVYEGNYPGTKIIAEYKPEADCLRDLFSNAATRMVVVTRGLTYQEAKYFQDTLHYVPSSEKIASDAIALVVNSKSNDTLFTLKELQGQLSGMLNNNKKMVFDGLNATSTVRFAIDSLLKGKKFDNNVVKAVRSSHEVLDFVASDINAIGFVGISWIGNPEDTAQVSMLKKIKMAYVKCEPCLDSPYVKPSQAGILTRRYPLIRGLYYILKENYSGLGSGFASFLKYERGQLVFRRAYLSPAQMSFEIRSVRLNEKLKKD